MSCRFFFFFFQAEDGIRDRDVTGVQTCALPIFEPPLRLGLVDLHALDRHDRRREALEDLAGWIRTRLRGGAVEAEDEGERRSEERRVGKECRARWGAGE